MCILAVHIISFNRKLSMPKAMSCRLGSQFKFCYTPIIVKKTQLQAQNENSGCLYVLMHVDEYAKMLNEFVKNENECQFIKMNVFLR